MLCMVEDCIFNLCPPVRIIIMLIIIMTIYQFPLVVQWLRIHLPMQEHGFIPFPKSGKIPHDAEQLSLCETTAKACMPRACALQQVKPPQLSSPCATIRK